jgi:hypothetical protein
VKNALSSPLKSPLRSPFVLSGTLSIPFDADAQAYITAVEAADGQALEQNVKVAINNFVVGCKDDGIWDAIKASCILAGARTLTGALVPLKGTAPTNFNFVSGDYSRTTGLVGNGSTKYLDSNRNNNADPQDNQSEGVFIHTVQPSGVAAYIGAGGGVETGATHIIVDYSLSVSTYRSRFGTTAASRSGGHLITGFSGMTRNSSSSFAFRLNGLSTTSNTASQTPASNSVYVFGRNFSNAVNAPTSGRLQFYWIGEALDLALLDARVTTLVSHLTFAVNTGLNPTNYDADTIAYVNAGYAAGGALA